jgi:hypothetical protein
MGARLSSAYPLKKGGFAKKCRVAGPKFRFPFILESVILGLDWLRKQGLFRVGDESGNNDWLPSLSSSNLMVS